VSLYMYMYMSGECTVALETSTEDMRKAYVKQGPHSSFISRSLATSARLAALP